jgi:hypothetical protein
MRLAICGVLPEMAAASQLPSFEMAGSASPPSQDDRKSWAASSTTCAARSLGFQESSAAPNARIAKRDIVPRAVEKLKRLEKPTTWHLGAVLNALSPRSGLSATPGWKLHSALFKVLLHHCVCGWVCGYLILRRRGAFPKS